MIRVRLKEVEALDRYVGVGSWKSVRGTSTYAHITGGGQVGNAWVEGEAWSERREGFVIAR